MSIKRYSDENPRSRIDALETLSSAARRWRGAGYPVTIIEDDREEVGPVGL